MFFWIFRIFFPWEHRWWRKTPYPAKKRVWGGSCAGDLGPVGLLDNVEGGWTEQPFFDVGFRIPWDGGQDVHISVFGDDGGGGFDGDVAAVQVVSADDDTGEIEARRANGVDGEQGVIDCAQIGSCDDDDGQIEDLGEIEDVDAL